ncbi:MAG: hypothetical protein ACTHN5_11715 [Phycisphaerae bacterium]
MKVDNEPIRLSHAELLLLDLVEEYSAWVKGVVDGDSWGSNNKRGSNSYSADVWGDAFARLGEHGLVEFYEERFGDEEVRLVKPTREDVMRELTRTDISFNYFDQRKPERPVCVYRLTPAGGAVWEQFARPQWNQYVDWGEESDDNGENSHGVARCVTKWPLERFLALSSQTGLRIDIHSVSWRMEKDWKPRYWKAVMEAYVVEYRVVEQKTPSWDSMPWGLARLLYEWKTKF